MDKEHDRSNYKQLIKYTVHKRIITWILWNISMDRWKYPGVDYKESL